MSRVRKLEKNSQGDFSQGLQLIRQTAAADSGATAITLAPTAIDAITATTSTGATNRFSCDGCRTYKLRMWSSSSGGTATVDVKEYPYPGPFPCLTGLTNTIAENLTRGRGNLICTVACTFSGSSLANINPVTGVASASTTWYELSTVSFTYQQDPRVRQLPSTAATSAEKLILIDALGAQWMYPEITAISAGTIIIAAQRVD